MPAELSHLRATVESVVGLWWGPRKGQIRLRPLNMTDSARGTIDAQRTRGKFKPRTVANMGISARPGSRLHAERSPGHQNPAVGGTRPRLPPACCLRLEKQAVNAANRFDRNGLAPPPPGQPGAFENSACPNLSSVRAFQTCRPTLLVHASERRQLAAHRERWIQERIGERTPRWLQHLDLRGAFPTRPAPAGPMWHTRVAQRVS